MVWARLWRSDRYRRCSQQPARDDSTDRFPGADVEWCPVRATLRLQPAAHFHWPVRNDPNVAAIDSLDAFEPQEHLHVHTRIPLQPVHDEPCWFCLAQRVQLVAPGRHRSDHWAEYV